MRIERSGSRMLEERHARHFFIPVNSPLQVLQPLTPHLHLSLQHPLASLAPSEMRIERSGSRMPEKRRARHILNSSQITSPSASTTNPSPSPPPLTPARFARSIRHAH
jgi:hypothetical protein